MDIFSLCNILYKWLVCIPKVFCSFARICYFVAHHARRYRPRPMPSPELVSLDCRHGSNHGWEKRPVLTAEISLPRILAWQCHVKLKTEHISKAISKAITKKKEKKQTKMVCKKILKFFDQGMSAITGTFRFTANMNGVSGEAGKGRRVHLRQLVLIHFSIAAKMKFYFECIFKDVIPSVFSRASKQSLTLPKVCFLVSPGKLYPLAELFFIAITGFSWKQ